AQNSLSAAQAHAQQADDQAAGQLSTARVQLQNAQAALAALQQGATPQQLQMDESQIQIDEVAVAAAQRALDAATLSAPSAGVVGQVNVTVGQSVSGGSGGASGAIGAASSSASSSSSTSTHAVVLLTPGAFQVTGAVSDAQVNLIADGQRALVTPAGTSR